LNPLRPAKEEVSRHTCEEKKKREKPPAVKNSSAELPVEKKERREGGCPRAAVEGREKEPRLFAFNRPLHIIFTRGGKGERPPFWVTEEKRGEEKSPYRGNSESKEPSSQWEKEKKVARDLSRH